MQLIVWNINHELYNKLCPREAGIESLCRKYLGKKKNIHINDLFSPKHRTKTLKIIRNNQMQTVLLRAHALPGDIAEKLMIDSVSTLLRGLQQEKEFMRVISLLKRGGVEFAVMKTFPYIADLHSEPMKAHVDLDILLPVSQYHKAERILLRDGYTHRPVRGADLRHGDFYVPYGEEIFLKGTMRVELHTTIVNTFGFETRVLTERTNRALTALLYTRTMTVSMHRMRVQALQPSALFLSLFLHHVYQHAYKSVMRYYEASRLLVSYRKKINWRWILDIVHRHKLTEYFFWYICFLDDLFPGVVPRHVLNQARNYQLKWSVVQMLLFFFLKRQLFHPVNEFSDYQKRLCWMLMEKRGVFLSVRSRVHAMMKKMKTHDIARESLW